MIIYIGIGLLVFFTALVYINYKNPNVKEFDSVAPAIFIGIAWPFTVPGFLAIGLLIWANKAARAAAAKIRQNGY